MLSLIFKLLPKKFNCFIDTFSWKKLDILAEKYGDKFIKDIILTNNIYITHEVMEELIYRNFSFISRNNILEYVTILPKIDIDYNTYQQDGFDAADASLIEYSNKEKIPVVTEDHPMLAIAVVNRYDFMQLVDFFVILNSLGQITNNKFQNIIRILRKMKNITKRKAKKLSDSI